MAKILDRSLEVKKFELHLRFYIHFWTNTLDKSMNSLISALCFMEYYFCSSERNNSQNIIELSKP